MAILGIIKVAMSSTKSGGLQREILATKVIPFLVPISIETSLNLNQVMIFLRLEYFVHYLILVQCIYGNNKRYVTNCRN